MGDPLPTALIFISCFIASVASTTVGAGGSLLLLSIAAAYPVQIAIPLHAVVSFAGNLNRWIFLHRFIDYKVVLLFAAGAVAGILLAAPLVNKVPPWSWQILLGSFLLLSTWWKPNKLNAAGRLFPYICGLVASFLSVFVGATKVFVASLLGQRFSDHKQVIGTTNACATLPHLGKIILFTSIGVAVFDHYLLILGLIAVNIVGVLVGRMILIEDKAGRLRTLLKVVSTVLGINLILLGLDLSPWN